MFRKMGFVLSGDDSERLRLILADGKEAQDARERQRPDWILYRVIRVLIRIFWVLLIVTLLIFSGMTF